MFECLFVMGIFNVMFDLFFDGGCFFVCDDVLCWVEWMIVEGVDLFDIGGELMCFGVLFVLFDEEFVCVILFVEVLWLLNVLLLIDIYKLVVMCVVLVVGVDLINDIWGFC